MKTSTLGRLALGFALGCQWLQAAAAPAPAPLAEPALSPTAIVASQAGRLAYVVEEEAQRVEELDLATGQVLRRLQMPARPTGAVLAADGRTLYVTAGCPAGVVVVQPLQGWWRSQRILEAGHSPMAPVLAGDGRTLFVCDRFRNQVLKLDLKSGKSAAIPVGREPTAAAMTPDGSRLVVPNLLPIGPANGESASATVSLIDTASGQVPKTITLVNGSISLRGVAVSPDGQFAFVISKA